MSEVDVVGEIIPDFGMGWSSYKGDKVPEGWLPLLSYPKSVDPLEEWVNGFASAYADCMDETETWQEALRRIAPAVYDAAIKFDVLR